MFYKDNEDFFEEYEDEDTLQEDIVLFENYIQGKCDHIFLGSDRLEALIEHYVLNNEHSQAILLCDYAFIQFPYEPFFKLRKAQSLLDLEHIDEAHELLISIEHLHVDPFEFIITKATLYSKMNNHKLSIEYFKKALPLTDDIELKCDVLLDLAVAYKMADQIPDAINLLMNLIRSDTKNMDLFVELIECHEKLNQPEQAIQFFQEILDIDPYSSFGWYYLGNLYKKYESIEKAMEAYQYCIAIDDMFSWAYLEMGESYMLQDMIHEAIEQFELYLNLEPNDPIALCLLASCYQKIDNIETSEYYFRKCISFSPLYVDAWIGLGVLEDIRGNTSSSLNFLNKANMLNPDDPEILYFLGIAYEKNKQFIEANDSYRKALSIKPDFEECLIDYISLINENFHPPFIENSNDIITFIEEYPRTFGENRMLMLLMVNQLDIAKRDWEAFLLFGDCMEISIDYAQEIVKVNRESTFVKTCEILKKLYEK